MKVHINLVVICLLSVSVASCKTESEEPAHPIEPVETSTFPLEPIETGTFASPEDTVEPVFSGKERLVELAIANLVERFGVREEKVEILKVEAFDWPDASLGCPQHGMAYVQVITPGFQILLQAEKVLYVYHTDEAERVILCQARPPDDIYPTP